MSIGILGIKVGMTQIFNKEGLAYPATIIQAGPCTVTQIKTIKHHGYNAIQIGYWRVHTTCLTKAQLGHLNKVNTTALRYLAEYRVKSTEEFQLGNLVTAQDFKIGQSVHISGKKIGKGFSGCQKRHNFCRGPMSHGSKNHRQPGSIGPGTTPGRVFPGKRMAGRSRSIMSTIKNLQIIDINCSQNLIVIKGAVPGAKGSLLNIKI
uniref:Large ribosomal subunit protein uL3c n=1 Tax=Hildenbrandia rivularis TaxID=135206 RepID=A0A1C9CFV1_9FLOR|nr:ribosomal protein L3 [Hildenbrandia rivularis]AOM67244.1 ribosomal protein L3 [Hildenbrandia rivularis]